MSATRTREPVDWVLLPLVMAGGAVGVLARYLIVVAVPAVEWVPILVINLAGSLALGIVAGVFGSAPRRRAFLGTGILGGFTSYSALAPVLGTGLMYTILSVPLAANAIVLMIVVGAVSIVCALAGLAIGRAILEGRAR